MDRRKIQLIAGTTYSVSLPKKWVIKNSLKESNDILMLEKSDRSLILYPHSIEDKKLNEISINVDDYMENIDQMLFVLYYIGIETINLFSKKELTKEVKLLIRKTIMHMSGTEINYEDTKKIVIKVLLDKSKVDIKQILYRISLILDLSMANIIEGIDMKEVEMNENEIDRLFHLMNKILTISLIDSNVLQSSGINNVSLIPSYLIIGKKLENIGDYAYNLAKYIEDKKIKFQYNEILNFFKSELDKSIRQILSDKFSERLSEENRKKIKNDIFKIENKIISDYLRDILRYVIDIEEEIVSISFYNKLISERVI